MVGRSRCVITPHPRPLGVAGDVMMVLIPDVTRVYIVLHPSLKDPGTQGLSPIYQRNRLSLKQTFHTDSNHIDRVILVHVY